MAIWAASQTLLLVGEGSTEVAFLRHVSRIYAPRGCGLRVTIKDAHGKGAKHVVEWTIRQRGIAGFDKVAVLLDTDQDWTSTVARRARSAGIQVLQSVPLFEAMMLRLVRQNDIGDARALKARFAPYVGHNPLDPGSYAMHYGRTCLETGKSIEPTILALLALFE